MGTVQDTTALQLKNLLLLTDFSEPSEGALRFAMAIGRGYGARVHVLHVLLPEAYVDATRDLSIAAVEGQEENARMEMQRIESQLAGLGHEAILERRTQVWPALREALESRAIDLVVLGTHGRTGAEKLLLGSVAEEVFRRAWVPVLTIGPGVHGEAHHAAYFHRILLAMDFTPESLGALPYAISLAQRNQARLTLLHVMKQKGHRTSREQRAFEISVAEANHLLYQTVPADAELAHAPEVAVEYGDPAEKIVQFARARKADLIVLGVRRAARELGPARHPGQATAYKVVGHAGCPVLTVRG